MLPKVRHLWLRAILMALTLAVVSSCSSGGGRSGYPTAPGDQREPDSTNIR